MSNYIRRLVSNAFGSDYDLNTAQALAIVEAAIEPFLMHDEAMDTALLRIMVATWFNGRTAGLTHALDMLKQI